LFPLSPRLYVTYFWRNIFLLCQMHKTRRCHSLTMLSITRTLQQNQKWQINFLLALNGHTRVLNVTSSLIGSDHLRNLYSSNMYFARKCHAYICQLRQLLQYRIQSTFIVRPFLMNIKDLQREVIKHIRIWYNVLVCVLCLSFLDNIPFYGSMNVPWLVN